LWHIDPLLSNDHKTMIQRPFARQQLCKYTIVLELLLGRGLRTTMQVVLEAVISIGPLSCYITQPAELSVVSAVQCSGAEWSGASWLVSECTSSVLPRLHHCLLALNYTD
jgi:hypothetical protein